MAEDSNVNTTRIEMSPTSEIDFYDTPAGSTVIGVGKHTLCIQSDTYSSTFYQFVINNKNADFMVTFANKILDAVHRQEFDVKEEGQE